MYGTDGAALWSAQQGRCAVCSVELMLLPLRSRHLDHNHATGEVRGWLCARCNRVAAIEKHPAIGALLKYIGFVIDKKAAHCDNDSVK